MPHPARVWLCLAQLGLWVSVRLPEIGFFLHNPLSGSGRPPEIGFVSQNCPTGGTGGPAGSRLFLSIRKLALFDAISLHCGAEWCQIGFVLHNRVLTCRPPDIPACPSLALFRIIAPGPRPLTGVPARELGSFRMIIQHRGMENDADACLAGELWGLGLPPSTPDHVSWFRFQIVDHNS
jgi:hypothetical protein